MPAPIAVTKAVSELRRAESGAASGGESNFTYTGSGKNDGKNGKLTTKGRSKKGLIVIILTIMLGGGAVFLGGSNSLLPPAIEELFTEATDTQYPSADVRSNRLLKTLIGASSDTRHNFKGQKVYTRMSNSYVKRLKASGIDVVNYNRLNPLSSSNVYLEYNGEKIYANDLLNKIAGDVEFRDAYTAAKRGRVATFFDKTANKIFGRLGITRNLWSLFKKSNDAESNKKKFRDTMAKKFNGDTTTTKNNKIENVKDEDGNDVVGEDGKPVVKVEEESETQAKTSSQIDVEANNTKAKEMLTSVGKASQAATIGCTIMKFASAISVMVAATEIYQSINYFMGLVENVSKMKAGEGNESAINEMLNFLTTSSKTRITDYSGLSIKGCADNLFDEGAGIEGCLVEEKYIDEEGSPLDSSMKNILSGTQVSPSSSSNYSLERVIAVLGGAITTTATTYQTCLAVETLDAIVTIGTAIVTGGASLVTQSITRFLIRASVALGISLFINFLTPIIAKAFFTNAFETATGIPAGELFTKGASASGTRLGRNGSGQSLSNRSAALSYNHLTREVIAQEAEIDRLNHSPFDVTNKNTFLGSIAYGLLPSLVYSGTTKVSSLLNTTKTALASITSNVTAEGEGSSYMTTFGDCPSLGSIGAVGDVYCNPITTTDLSTIGIDPIATENDVSNGLISQDDYNLSQQYIEKINENLTGCEGDNYENCSPTIVKNSNLEKYIMYCSNRNSPFGVVDQNILGNMRNPIGSSGSSSTSSSVAGTAADSIVNSIPIFGDAKTIIESGIDEANLPWATGERCGNTDNNREFWQSEGRFYQRYIEDTRLLEERGAYEQDESDEVSIVNPVEELETRWETEHPTDNSQTGFLSRISGLTKENVEDTLAVMDYLQFIEDYDAAERIALVDQSEKLAQIVASQQKSLHQPYTSELIATSITKQFVIYSDIRNRNYAV